MTTQEPQPNTNDISGKEWEAMRNRKLYTSHVKDSSLPIANRGKAGGKLIIEAGKEFFQGTKRELRGSHNNTKHQNVHEHEPHIEHHDSNHVLNNSHSENIPHESDLHRSRENTRDLHGSYENTRDLHTSQENHIPPAPASDPPAPIPPVESKKRKAEVMTEKEMYYKSERELHYRKVKDPNRTLMERTKSGGSLLLTAAKELGTGGKKEYYSSREHKNNNAHGNSNNQSNEAYIPPPAYEERHYQPDTHQETIDLTKPDAETAGSVPLRKEENKHSEARRKKTAVLRDHQLPLAPRAKAGAGALLEATKEIYHGSKREFKERRHSKGESHLEHDSRAENHHTEA